MVELVQIDINTDLFSLASHFEFLGEGQLKAVLKSFSYIWGKHNYGLALDPKYLEINNVSFKDHNWVDFYGNVNEEITPNTPDPRGKDNDLIMYVDRNHARDKSTCRSRIGFLIRERTDKNELVRC